MSITVTKAHGVTVLTLAPAPQSSYPLLCQILSGLCCNPMCCAVSESLRKVQGASQSLLGAVHIMVGLLNIGLGASLATCSSPYPFWLGGMFILFGTVGILSEKYPSPCLVILNVILNLFGVLFAIAAIVLYSIDIAVRDLWWLCDDDYRFQYQTPSPEEESLQEKCLQGKALLLLLSRSVMGVLIILSVLELCVTISCAVLGIKSLRNHEKTENTGESEKSEQAAALLP